LATHRDKPVRKVRGGSTLGNDWELQTRQKLQASGIANRLIDHVNGLVKLEPSQVTAGLGLLKKVLPDVVFIEHSGEVTTTKVIRTPTVANDLDAWRQQFVDQPEKLN